MENEIDSVDKDNAAAEELEERLEEEDRIDVFPSDESDEDSDEDYEKPLVEKLDEAIKINPWDLLGRK